MVVGFAMSHHFLGFGPRGARHVYLIKPSFTLVRPRVNRKAPHRRPAAIEKCGWSVSRILSRALPPRDDHSSGLIVTNQPLAANPGLCGPSTHAASDTRPLFGIAPGGACHAVCVATSAVGSYPTFSPLPPYRRQSVLCGAIPRVTPAGYYPAPCFSWSPDFPRGVTTPRPSDHPHLPATC